MNQWDDPTLSRRRALGLASALAVSEASAQPQTTPATDPNLGARVYNIRNFGAKGGTTLDTAAVQPAIDTCHRDHGFDFARVVPAGERHVGKLHRHGTR